MAIADRGFKESSAAHDTGSILKCVSRPTLTLAINRYKTIFAHTASEVSVGLLQLWAKLASCLPLSAAVLGSFTASADACTYSAVLADHTVLTERIVLVGDLTSLTNVAESTTKCADEASFTLHAASNVGCSTGKRSRRTWDVFFCLLLVVMPNGSSLATGTANRSMTVPTRATDITCSDREGIDWTRSGGGIVNRRDRSSRS